jgi:hypothetical protein
MIPPTPFPGNFHNRGYLYGSHGCFGGGHHGGVYHGGYSQPCQSCQSGYVTEYQAMPNQVEYAMQQPVPQAQMHVAHQAPQRTQIVRPAAKKSGFGGLRLASLTELFD